MAGITNRAFRRLCRESGAGIYVSEMITSRALLERNDETMALIRFDDDEAPRSLQLYGVDPAIIAAAVRMVVTEDLADHVDLNFGCPVPKVTRKGGGSALPWKRDLFREVVSRAVASADGRVPVTVKMRKGIDDDHLTYLEAGRAAAQEGAAWVALHGRTAEQMYGGQADWGDRSWPPGVSTAAARGHTTVIRTSGSQHPRCPGSFATGRILGYPDDEGSPSRRQSTSDR